MSKADNSGEMLGRESGAEMVGQIEMQLVEQKDEQPTKLGRPEGAGDRTPRKKRTDNKANSDRMKALHAGNPEDNNRFLAHALRQWSMPKIELEDEVAVEERIIWYFGTCLEDNVKPTVNGLAGALGCDRRTLNNWVNGYTRADTHLDMAKKAYQLLNIMWESYMQEGKMNPIVGIFLGKNHFGYVDKQEMVIEPRQTVVQGEQMADVLELYGSKNKNIEQIAEVAESEKKSGEKIE